MFCHTGGYEKKISLRPNVIFRDTAGRVYLRKGMRGVLERKMCEGWVVIKGRCPEVTYESIDHIAEQGDSPRSSKSW